MRERRSHREVFPSGGIAWGDYKILDRIVTTVDISEREAAY